MAHFAELNENNIVTQVIVVHNNELLDDDGNESEAKGIAFLKILLVLIKNMLNARIIHGTINTTMQMRQNIVTSLKHLGLDTQL